MRCLTRLLSISLLLAGLAGPALAQVTPIIFERTNIRIEPTPIRGEENEATLLRAATTYNIELRSEDALKLEYIHTLNTLNDDTGVMIMFAAPSVVPLPAWQVFTKVDAVFLAEDGTILQILPSVALGNMTQDIYAREPVKAFLFLKEGQVAARYLRPRDVVTGSMFVPAPPVME